MKNENYIHIDDLVCHEGKVKGFYGADLLNLAQGGIKVVKVAPKASYPMHVHPDKTEFVYLIKGIVNCYIENENYDLTIGNFAIFPKGMMHKIENPSDFEATLLIGNIKE